MAKRSTKKTSLINKQIIFALATALVVLTAFGLYYKINMMPKAEPSMFPFDIETEPVMDLPPSTPSPTTSSPISLTNGLHVALELRSIHPTGMTDKLMDRNFNSAVSCNAARRNDIAITSFQMQKDDGSFVDALRTDNCYSGYKPQPYFKASDFAPMNTSRAWRFKLEVASRYSCSWEFAPDYRTGVITSRGNSCADFQYVQGVKHTDNGSLISALYVHLYDNTEPSPIPVETPEPTPTPTPTPKPTPVPPTKVPTPTPLPLRTNGLHVLLNKNGIRVQDADFSTKCAGEKISGLTFTTAQYQVPNGVYMGTVQSLRVKPDPCYNSGAAPQPLFKTSNVRYDTLKWKLGISIPSEYSCSWSFKKDYRNKSDDYVGYNCSNIILPEVSSAIYNNLYSALLIKLRTN